jgi:hypothetical protein
MSCPTSRSSGPGARVARPPAAERARSADNVASTSLTIIAVLIVVGRLYLRARALSPAVYRNLSLEELQPFFRSWGVWLGNRGDILVGHARVAGIVQFRKHVYKRQPNTLVFRYRNVDDSRRNFPVVHAAFDAAKTAYDLELTRHTRRPRAVAVALDARDVLMLAAAVRLVATAFGALGAHTPEFLIWCEGRVQAVPDRAGILMIPEVAARRAGFRLGVALARILRWVWVPRT